MVFLLGPVFFEMTWKYLDPDISGFFSKRRFVHSKNPGFLNPLLVSNSEMAANPIGKRLRFQGLGPLHRIPRIHHDWW